MSRTRNPSFLRKPVVVACMFALSGCSHGTTSSEIPSSNAPGAIDFEARRNAVPRADEITQIEKETAAENGRELANFKAAFFAQAKSASVARLMQPSDRKGDEWAELTPLLR
jgi:hypothetical protein